MRITARNRPAGIVFATMASLFSVFLLVFVPIVLITQNQAYERQLRLDWVGREAVAYIDDIEKQYAWCGRTSCNSYDVTYHFSIAGSGQVVSGKANVLKHITQTTVRYDPGDPADNLLAENRLSLLGVYGAPALILAVGILPTLLAWNTWKDLLRYPRHKRA